MFLNFVKNNLSQVLQFGSRWVLNLVLIVTMTKEQFANFSFAYSISNILMGVLPFGSAVYLLNTHKKSIKNELENSIIIFIVLQAVVLLIYALLSIFLSNVEGWRYIFLGILLGIPFSLNLILFSYFKSINKFNIDLISQFIFCVIIFLFCAYVILNKSINIDFAFGFLILVNLFFSLYVSRLAKINYCFILRNLNKSFELIQKRKFYGGQEILNTIINQFSLVILFYLLIKEDYAVFRIFLILISPFMLFTTATGQVVLLFLKKNIDNLQKVKKFFSLSQLLMVLFGVLCCVLMYVLTDFIFKYFEIDLKYTIAFYLTLATIVLRLCLSNNEMLLVVLNHQRYRFYIMLWSAIFSLIFIFLMTSSLGIMAAILANLLANFIMLYCTSYFVFRIWKKEL